jgi:hypothetical protein
MPAPVETSHCDLLDAVRKIRKVFSKDQRCETEYDRLMTDAVAACGVRRSGLGV